VLAARDQVDLVRLEAEALLSEHQAYLLGAGGETEVVELDHRDASVSDVKGGRVAIGMGDAPVGPISH
jgi:hypothetical protein